jgi:hypothetical protein
LYKSNIYVMIQLEEAAVLIIVLPVNIIVQGKYIQNELFVGGPELLIMNYVYTYRVTHLEEGPYV